MLFVTDCTKRSAGPQRGKQRSDSTKELRDHIALDQAEGDYYHTSIWVVRCHSIVFHSASCMLDIPIMQYTGFSNKPIDEQLLMQIYWKT